MEIWNDRFISSPPVITVLFEKNELSKLCELTSQKPSKQDSSLHVHTPEIWVTNLNEILRKAKEQLVDVSGFMELELKCLHSYIYQGGGAHKKEKYVSAIKKVARCLKRYKEINIQKLIAVNYDMIPKDFFSIQRIRLPSPKLMYYLLHRLVGSFHLLLKSVSYGLESSFYFKAKLVRGFSISTSMLGFAIIGRIRALALDYCNIISKLSDQLYPYVVAMSKLKDLQKIEDLPNNLQEVLKEFLQKEDVKRPKEKLNEKTKKRRERNNKKASEEQVKEEEDFSSSSLQPSKYVKKENENLENKNMKDSFQSFSFTAACKDNDEDLGDAVSYSKFNELKKLSNFILESSISKKNRRGSKKKGKKPFAEEDCHNLKNKQRKVGIESKKKGKKRFAEEDCHNLKNKQRKVGIENGKNNGKKRRK